MSRVLLFLIGAILGAALFHIHYLGLAPTARCGWDHPLDREARESCRAAGATAPSYPSKARHELDDLVGNVSR